MAPHPIPEATRRFAFASIGITTPEYAEQWKPAPSPTEPERHPEWMDAKALNAAPIVPREVAAGVDCCAHRYRYRGETVEAGLQRMRGCCWHDRPRDPHAAARAGVRRGTLRALRKGQHLSRNHGDGGVTPASTARVELSQRQGWCTEESIGITRATRSMQASSGVHIRV